ncbi:ubiquinol oxidase subunit II [Azospirillum picis]|uniref:Ubiquinol oxidase subunit 2 n=1 Tax=Azospirillum picis TaxID=488438 RepID=A0ABU0MQN1_9PROT|nr:ubiquinol oxidase subunit II [Azospirillum picis]MBP2302191.1 cytochrome o ubiquinol oxidase subunit 2 [Azospirillum picis]MDQ0535770.1 cytochrome o ubiquinol oxidase subunit 2 [Azospirillum picis]
MDCLQVVKSAPARARMGRGLSLGRGLVLAFAGLGLAACSGGVLDPLGPVGEGDAEILINATVIMLVIVVPTILMAFWIAWRYRASNTRAEYLPYWSYSGRVEAVVWSIPILTILFIGGVIWIGSHRLDPFRPLESDVPPIEVQVVSLDWKWLFIYPEQGIAAVNQLVVPAGTPVRFSITSASVFNAFFVPRLGSMIYAMPGMVSQLHLQADDPGEMWGISAQFSGDGFSDMNFQVRSLAAADFEAWVGGTRGAGPVLDQAAYAGLTHQSARVPPSTFRAVDPRLFEAVATQAHPPGPGPQPGGAPHAGREATTGGKD